MDREDGMGWSVPRREGPDKLTGKAVYTADLNPFDCLHGVTVRSPVARGRISTG